MSFESNETFSDKLKPLYFEQNRDRFRHYERKITYITLPPIFKSEIARIRGDHLLWLGWEIEVFERNKAFLAVLEDPEIQEGDWIIFSDVDEIPRVGILQALLAATEKEQEDDEDEEQQDEEGQEPQMVTPWVILKGKDILRLQCQYFQLSFEYKCDSRGQNGLMLLQYRERNSARFNFTRDQQDIARGIKTKEEVEELYQIMERRWIHGGHYLRMARENKNLPQIQDSLLALLLLFAGDEGRGPGNWSLIPISSSIWKSSRPWIISSRWQRRVAISLTELIPLHTFLKTGTCR